MIAPAGVPSPSRWVSYYLNTRFFRFPDGIRVRAREGWDFPKEDKDRNLLRTVHGQEKYLEQHKQASGTVELNGAKAHWWILRDEAAMTQNSGSVASTGHIAALHRDELYELSMGRAGVARLQQFGVVFGYRQVVIYVEPVVRDGERLSSNTARTNLLLNSESLPWADWAAEFRRNMPEEISDLMDSITAGSTSSDHKKAIRDRLKEIKDLFRFSRYRPTTTGDKITDPDRTAGGTPRANGSTSSGKSPSGGKGGNSGNIYTLFLSDDGVPSEEFFGSNEPDVKWVTVGEGTRTAGVLEDRAAKYIPEMNLLQINGDFRGFTALVDRWVELYGDSPGTRAAVVDACREWFEQSLIETVMGVMALKDSREWTQDDISRSLSEEALTSAVMPRYHIDVAVKRALGAKLGSLKDR
jgi:hypothetical protein